VSETETIIATLVALSIPLGLFAFLGYWLWRSIHRDPVVQATRASFQGVDLAASRARAESTQARVILSDAATRDEVVDQHGFGVYRSMRLTLEVSRPSQQEGARFGCVVVWDIQIGALGLVAPQSEVAVLLDPRDERLVFPAAGWARLSRDFPLPKL